MLDSGQTRRTLGALLLWAIMLPRGVAFADLAVYSAFASEWKVLPGLMEASSPDPTAWRLLEFDDSAWSTALGPIGYGNTPPYGTDLSTADPPMQGNYSSVFLRHTFEVPDRSRVAEFRARVIYDDGLLIWINGKELQRLALAGELGEFVPFDVTAAQAHTSSRVEEIVFEDPASFLVDGTNIIAVQVFNRALDNVDLKFDIELFDPSGPDLQPPRLVEVFPLPVTTVRKLTEVEVLFDEGVALEAGDLLVGGVAAMRLEGSGAGPYRFSFLEPPAGEVRVQWRAEHGITDLSPDRNPFAGGSWTYRLDPEAPAPDLVISEILVANRKGLQDPDGDFEPWVEILNRGVEPVSLFRFSLSDDPRTPGKWIFPKVVLAPEEHLVVFVSGKDLTDADRPLHTSFVLDVPGDYLGLFSGDNPPEVLDELAPGFPPQQPDVAYGLAFSGARSYLTPPTPGMPNDDATALEAVVVAPVASVAHGFFESAFELELLGSTPGAEIRYSTDGSEPEQEDALYSGPLTIRQTTPLRARAFKEGWVPSPITTRSYIFLDDVLLQGDVNREVVNDPATSGIIKDAMLSIPTMSLVIEPEQMFSPSGAYNSKGDHPTSVELINPDGEGGFQVDCAMERHSEAFPKTSLRLKFKREYGPEKLRYRLFESAPLHADSAVNFFDRIVLRGGKNQSWSSGVFRTLVTYVEDQWVRDSQIAMSGIGSHGTFVHLYINGVYWGLYNPVERPDHWFTSAYFGGSGEDYFATNFNITQGHGQHIRGDPSRFDRLIELADARDLEDPRKYEQFQEFVDVDRFIDYVILFWYSGFGDGVNNNWYAGMRLTPPGKFLFFMWDGEIIFLKAASPPGHEAAWVPPHFFLLDNTPIVRIWKALLESEEFRMRFADRVYKHCFNHGALSEENARQRLKTLADFIQDAIIGESARWGGQRTRDATWRPAVAILDGKMEGNSETFIRALRSWSHADWPDIHLYPVIDPPVFNQSGGTVEKGFAVRLFSPGPRVLYTLDGSDPRLAGGEVSARALEYPPSSVLHVVDAGANARVHVPEDGDLGLRWTEPGFDDSGWLEGQTGVGFDRSDRAPHLNAEILTDVGESMFTHSSSAYLRLEFSLEDLNFDFFWLDMKYEDGFAAYLNGELVASANTPEDLQWGSNATESPSVDRAVEFQEFDIAARRDLLVVGRNLLAIHGLNLYAGDRDFLVLPRLRRGAFAPERITIEAATQVRARALSGGVWSAVDEATFTVPAGSPAHLEITEISYNPAPDGAEFIEIHNPAGETVNLEGVEFSGGIQFRFAAGETLAAGGYLVLARDADVFALNYPGVPLAGTYVGRLANEGERVGLRDALGITIVSLEYNDGDFWPLGPDGFGYTLVPADGALDPDDPRAWRASAAPLGSPTAPDPEPVDEGVFISEVLTHTSDGSGAVELWNFTERNLDLGGWFLSPDRTDAASLKAYEIPAGTVITARDVGGGGFLVLAEADLGFGLDALGGGVYLASAGGMGELTGYIVGADFGAAETDVPFGLHETSDGLLEFTALQSTTLGAPNAPPRSPEVAVNELHYHPPDGESEFLELFNPAGAAVDLSGWRVRGISDPLDEGSFVFPPGTVVPAVGFLVLVPTDPERFRTSYGVPPRAVVVGPYGGALSNAGETLRLEKPVRRAAGVFRAAEAFVRVDKVRYDDRAPWPRQPDGDGNSLERIRAQDFGGEVLNWDTSVPLGGTPGATNSVSEPKEPPPGGGQRPGDVTQDATVNILDAIVLLDYLFGTGPLPLPCGGGTLEDAGNRMLLDADGTGRVDLTDALHLVNYLFLRGPTPALGFSCVPMVGCPESCGP